MPSPFKESTSKLDNSVVGPGFVLRGPLENPTNDAVTSRLKGGHFHVLCQICRVEDILVEGLIQGSVVHFHRMRTVTVPLTGTISTSRMGRTGGVGKGHLLSNGIGSGGGYGGTAGHGCYNDTCIEGDLPYGDAELPCQLGSGGGNDSTAGGGVLGVC
ncbi:hypothetical protein Tco_1258017 [Tanacetum coccineum]